MFYETRAMVALQELTYFEQPLKPGDPFEATPVDAAYLARCGRAQYAPAAAAVPAQQVVDAPVVTMTPPPASAPDATPEPEAAPAAAPAPAPTSRRRSTAAAPTPAASASTDEPGAA